MKFKKFGKALAACALSAGVVLGLTSCVQSYTVGFLYVTDTITAQPGGHGNIDGFKIDHNTGNLVAIHGFPVSSGGSNPIRSVLVTGSRFLYVLNRGANSAGGSDCTTDDPCQNSNITVFAVGANGILTPQGPQYYSKGRNPFRLLADTSGNYLFVLDHDAPSSEGCKLALGGSTTACGDITVFQINSTTGRLSLVQNAQVTVPGGGALPYFPVPANPIDFQLTSGYMLTITGTPEIGDSSFPYAYNASSGQLSLSQNSEQPLNIKEATAIDIGGGNVYVLDNEPIRVGGAVASQSQFLVYSIGTNGALQIAPNGAVPDDVAQEGPTQLLVESKGKYVYLANQGNNSTTTGYAQSGITVYELQTAPSITFTELGGIQYGSGAGPQCIVEDPSDQFIYTANFNDSSVTGKALNVLTGQLDTLPAKSSQFSVSGPATWCVVNGRTN